MELNVILSYHHSQYKFTQLIMHEIRRNWVMSGKSKSQNIKHDVLNLPDKSCTAIELLCIDSLNAFHLNSWHDAIISTIKTHKLRGISCVNSVQRLFDKGWAAGPFDIITVLAGSFKWWKAKVFDRPFVCCPKLKLNDKVHILSNY